MTQDEDLLPELEGLTPLPIPVPSSLEGALGYTGEGRFLAIWWEPAGDEAMWSDGRTTTTGYWPGYLAYVQHPKIEPSLFHYDLGSSEEPAEHYLLLDLVDRQAYVGTARQVERFLQDHVPRPDLSVEQAEMIIQALQDRPLIVDHDAIERELQFRSLAVNSLSARGGPMFVAMGGLMFVAMGGL